MKPPLKKAKIPARKLNILIHRYLGYFFAGLTIIYCISGLAVNHIEDWNPNFIIEKNKVSIFPLKDPENLTNNELEKILESLKVKQKPKDDNIFYSEEEVIDVVLTEGEKITINTFENTAEHEKITKIPLLHAFNFLHLNNPKKIWTFYADFFALCLLIISFTGLFMKKGKEGFWGKGGLLLIAGLIPPLIFLFIYY